MGRKIVVYRDFEQASKLLRSAVLLMFVAGMFVPAALIAEPFSFEGLLGFGVVYACLLWAWVFLEDRERLMEVVE